MKKVLLLFFLFLIGSLVVFIPSCEDDPAESCVQEEICEAKLVTTCCIDNECVYKYNGKEYCEEDIDQLYEDMGCPTKSGGYECDMAIIISRLQKLMDKARKGR